MNQQYGNEKKEWGIVGLMIEVIHKEKMVVKSNKLPASRTSLYVSIGSLIIFLLLIGIYIYLLHTAVMKEWLASIRNLGVLGRVVTIFVQTLIDTVPVPGEFISIFLIELYGPVAGGIYSWIGGTLGAILAYHLSTWIARPVMEPLTRTYLKKVDKWMKKYGVMGLLIVRLVPIIPYHLINYAAGILRVNKKVFIWTTAIGIIPYTIAVSSLYSGLRHGSLVPLIFGVVIFAISVMVSFVLRRKT